MVVYLVFIGIGLDKNRKNPKQFKKKKYLSIVVLGIVNAMLVSHEIEYSLTDLFFFLLIGMSLIALLIYVNDLEVL
jgi:hypothetical protein